MITLRIDCLNNLLIWNSAVIYLPCGNYIISPIRIYLINWNFVPFHYLHQFYLPLSSPSGNHKSSFLWICLLLKYNWPSVHFRMITTISLVKICHLSKILITLDCVSHIVNFIFMTHLFFFWTLYPLISLFSPLPISTLTTTCFLLLPITLAVCHICSFILFLVSTYKWNHMILSFSDLFHLASHPPGSSMLL